MMETATSSRGNRGTGGLTINGASRRGRGSKNKHWPAQNKGVTDSERWERGGYRGSRGRGGHMRSEILSSQSPDLQDEQLSYDEMATDDEADPDNEMEEQEHQEADVVDYQELVKAREAERKKAIAEGKMDDPLVPKRLDQAITMVGTCMDMCPRFERYRRERENNLTEWEVIPGTKRVDHRKAVKMYERAAGDKTLPSDLRPPHVLKKTLDYLFHDLLPRGGFNATFSFIRDRTRAVRSDFTMQHEMGPLAIECHDRCARFHILALHFQRDQPGFSIALEEQLLMNTLQSLKEYHEDQRGKYQSPTELEMRVYHRLIHIRDQRERHDDIPTHILENPVFKLITRFRQHVQAKSAPITKNSTLVVGDEGMAIFGELAHVLRQERNTVMIYLVACILERLFGKGAVQDNLEDIRGDLSIPGIIDGKLPSAPEEVVKDKQNEEPSSWVESSESTKSTFLSSSTASPFAPLPSSSSFATLSSSKPPVPAKNAFSALVATPNAFGNSSVFGPKTIFGSTSASAAVETSPFSAAASQNESSSVFGSKPSPFGSATTVSQTPASKEPLQNPPVPSSSAVSSAFLTVEPSGPSFSTWKENMAFSTPGVKPLNATTPPFHPQTYYSPSFEPMINEPISVSAAPAQTIQSAGTENDSNTLFSTSQSAVPTSTVIPPSPTSEQSRVLQNSFVPTQTSSEFPSPSSMPNRPPRINTDLRELSTLVSSPQLPPLLKRMEPVSLPSTTPSTPTVQQPSLQSNKSLKGFPSLQSLASSSTYMLSPLNLTSPVASRFPFPLQSKSPSKVGSISLLEAEGTIASSNRPVWSKEKAYEKASSFAARSLIVKDSFTLWKRKTGVKAEYLEAVKRSNEYSKQVHRDRMLSASSSAPSVSGSDRKRRTSGMPLGSSRAKRARNRTSWRYVPPRTDDDLVQRLKENRDEHERRWARGTFLETLRSYVNQSSTNLSQWHAWLSMNPENDGTAIWLERKFDIPSSGRWVSDSVFSMNLSSTDVSLSSTESPGLIIFECTPLEDLDDELEKKYRVLDDCSRLREVILTLPAERQYIPSLLLIVWMDSQLGEVSSDFRDMVTDMIHEKILKTSSTLSLSSSGNDLNKKFTDTILPMQLDLHGELVQRCIGNALIRSFSSLWGDSVSYWTDSCYVDGQLDWTSYGECLQATVNLLIIMARHVLTLLSGAAKTVTIPVLVAENIQDSPSAYSSVTAWLDHAEWGGMSAEVLQVVRSHKNLGIEFPVTAFHQYLPDLIATVLEHITGRKFDSAVSVLKEELSDALRQFERELESYNDKLIELRTIRNSRMGVKRRPLATSYPPHKRPRTSFTNDEPQSPSLNSSLNGSSSPPSSSPSVATSVDGSVKPAVTVTTLRELTRSVMKKYGSS